MELRQCDVSRTHKSESAGYHASVVVGGLNTSGRFAPIVSGGQSVRAATSC